jgi:hypothetical protein
VGHEPNCRAAFLSGEMRLIELAECL